MDTINKRIKYYRKKAGYCQYDVAEMLDMKLDTYSKMERFGNISCEILIKLSDILQVNPLLLLYNEEDITLPDEEELTDEPIDLSGVPPLLADNIYEKFAVLAMRNFS